MNENFALVFLFLIPLSIIGVLIYFGIRARNMVKNWAKKNNYEIVKLRERYYWKGPFEFDHSRRRQKIFYVKVINEKGRVEGAFVKCGDFWKGLLVDKVEVKWEKDRRKKLPG